MRRPDGSDGPMRPLSTLESIPPTSTGEGGESGVPSLNSLFQNGPVVVVYANGLTDAASEPRTMTPVNSQNRPPTRNRNTDMVLFGTGGYRRTRPSVLERLRGRKSMAVMTAALALSGLVKFTSAGADICDGVPLCASSFLASGESMPDTITSTASLPDIKTGDRVRKLATYTIAPQGFLQWKGTDGKINPSSVTVDVSLDPDIAKLTAVGATGFDRTNTMPKYLSFLAIKKNPDACISDVQKIADTAIEHAPALASAGNITIDNKKLINPYKYAPYTSKPLPSDAKDEVRVFVSYSFTGASETVARQTGFTSRNAQHAVINAGNIAACLPAKQ